MNSGVKWGRGPGDAAAVDAKTVGIFLSWWVFGLSESQDMTEEGQYSEEIWSKLGSLGEEMSRSLDLTEPWY